MQRMTERNRLRQVGETTKYTNYTKEEQVVRQEN